MCTGEDTQCAQERIQGAHRRGYRVRSGEDTGCAQERIQGAHRRGYRVCTGEERKKAKEEKKLFFLPKNTSKMALKCLPIKSQKSVPGVTAP